MSTATLPLRHFLLALAVVAIWGSNFVVIKFALHTLPPMTLAALLNSLQLGFRTLAIEQRSAEVWELLGAVRGEFARFGLLLEKTQKKLQEASFSIESAAKTSRSMEQRLSSLQQWRSEGVLDEPDNL